MGEPAPDVERIVTQFVAALTSKVHVEQVILFGSRARGIAADDSDIDLLIVSPDFGRDVLADYTLLYRCMPAARVDIDVIARTPVQIASAEPETFLATALEDGVVPACQLAFRTFGDVRSCHTLLGVPANLNPVGTLSSKQKHAWVALAACMRSHGFPTFPDPQFGRGPSRSGAPGGKSAVISIDGATFVLGSSIDSQTTQFQQAFSTCRQMSGAGGTRQ